MGCCYSSSAQVDPEATITLPNTERIAIIGGGLAGLSSAYYLAKKGKKVEVFEKNDRVGAECSYGPAGVTMWKSVKRGLNFWTVDPTVGGAKGAAEWLEGMAWQVLDPDPRRDSIMLQARDAHTQFLKDNPDSQPIMHDEGLLYTLSENLFQENKKIFANDPSMVFFTKAEFEKSQWYSPIFDGCDYFGVLWSKEEGAIDPHRLVHFMASKVVAMGGRVHTNSHVERLAEDKEKGSVDVFVKGGQRSSFDGCVVAVGAVTHPSKLIRASGFDDGVDEIYGVKGYTVTGRMPQNYCKMGFVDAVDTKFIRPFTDQNGNFCIRAGSLADPFDENNPLEIVWDRLETFKNNQYLKKVFEQNAKIDDAGRGSDTLHDAVVEEGKIEVWTGIRPVNKHGRVPIFRWVHGSDRVLVVSGFGSNGYVMCWHAGPRVAGIFP